MTDKFNKAAKIAQACYQASPVIVLGSGASAPYGLASMADLKDRLLSNINAVGTAEEDSWLLVKTGFAAGEHLEQAMLGKNLPSSLTEKIVTETWRVIAEKDRKVFEATLADKIQFPLTRLLQGMFQSSQTRIDIVTTNYDRIAEYACGAAGVICSTGFVPGYVRDTEGSEPISYARGRHQYKTARIWKVHGSLDWFARPDSTILSAPVFDEIPENLQPVIVTPGLSKFERTYDEPFRTAIQGADRALEQALGFICIGYGFRDTHVQPKLVSRCKQKNVPVAIAAKELTDEAKEFLKSSAGTNYLGIEQDGDGTRFYTNEEPDGFILPNSDHWSFDGFLKLVLPN